MNTPFAVVLPRSGMRRGMGRYLVGECDMPDRYLFLDESGNLGSSGRYFVIACVETPDRKSLENIMKKKLGKAKSLFPALGLKASHEIKAKDAYPCVRYHILECIARKNVRISYIVADLNHVPVAKLADKNLFYNYLMKILLCRLITQKDIGNNIHILYDDHTTKGGSVNSFEEYITLALLYERGLNLSLDFSRMDSNDGHAYGIQAADYVANALYSHFEYNNNLYYKRFSSLIHKPLTYPIRNFGK